MPAGLDTSSSSAPNARIVVSFSGAKASEDTMLQRVPLDRADEGERRARAAARVLDHRLARLSRPSRSAPSIMASAIRSL